MMNAEQAPLSANGKRQVFCVSVPLVNAFIFSRYNLNYMTINMLGRVGLEKQL
jgi:hypothetical protein